MEDLKWKSDKDLISHIENGGEYNEQEVIKLLVERLKRATEPRNDETYGSFMGRKFEDFINNFSCDEDGFVDSVIHKYHRTLQQKLFGLMLKTINAIAEQENWRVDGRNEYAYNTAKKLQTFFKENNISVNCPCI